MTAGLETPAPGPSAHLSERAVRQVIIGLMLAILLGALDQTIIAVALPRMAEQLHGFGLLSWVVSGYLVAATVIAPIYGKLGDLFGRRLLLSVALSVFLIASVLCALAQDMVSLVAFRILQGLGGGGLISISQAIIADVVALRERGKYQGYISGVYAVSSVAGPVVGGLLTHYLSWRWCFWINLPLGFAAILVSRRALAQLPIPGIRRPIDFTGALLLVAGLSGLLIAVTRIGQGVAWSSAGNVELFGAAIIVLAIFVIWEGHADEPIVPLGLFRIRGVALCFGVLFLAYFNLIAMSVLLPLRFQAVLGITADVAAWRLVPLSIFIPCGAFLAGRLMVRTGRYRPIQLAGTSLVPFALVGLAYTAPASVFLTAITMAVAGFGVGLQFPTSLVAVQNAVPSAQIGIATACQALFRSLGGAIGIALMGSVLLAMLHREASGSQALESGTNLLRELVAASRLGTDSAAHDAMRAVSEDAFRRVFTVAAIVALIPIALTLCIPDRMLGDRRK